MKELGERLRRLRESVKLSQVKMAELLGVKQSSNRIAPIYNDVTQGLDNYHFWHSNIKLSNDVTVNV